MTKDSNDIQAAGAAIPRLLRDGIDTVSAKSSDAAELARAKATKAVDAAKDGLDHAREALGDAYASGRGRASNVYELGRNRANETYAAARDRVRAAGDNAAERLDGNPLAAVLGGIALGVAFGVLLPRSETETKILGGVGNKLNDLAREALDAAKEAGQAKLADLGLTPDKAREAVHTLIDGALAAATSAGNAAVDTASTRSKG